MSFAADANITKLREFPAHAETVTCVALGPKSGNVAVTGGRDKKVNIWCSDRPNCLGSLQGHTTAISCIQFSPSELQICAGSEAGALKLWDIKASKLLRTLMGHRGTIKCLDFDVDGEIIVSGSSDSVIKMWDPRKRGCILGYQGHPSSIITTLKFSPCGQFVSSGGTDCHIKIWDLRTGKLFHEFNEHAGHINHIVFHRSCPTVMASASMDRSVKLHEWKAGTMISSVKGDKCITRRLVCHPQQHSVFAAGEGFLSAILGEKWDSHAHLVAPWGKVHDLVMPTSRPDTLFAVSSKWSSIAFFSVKPSLKKSCRPAPSCPVISSQPLLVPKSVTETTLKPSTAVPVCVAAEAPYETVFIPQKALPRTPPKDSSPIAADESVTSIDYDASQSKPVLPPIDTTQEDNYGTKSLDLTEDKNQANVSSEFVSANSSLSSSNYESTSPAPVLSYDPGPGQSTPPMPSTAEVEIQANMDMTISIAADPTCCTPRKSPSGSKTFRSEKTFVVDTVSSDPLENLVSQSLQIRAQLHTRLLELLDLHKVWTTKDKRVYTKRAVASSDVTVLVSFLEIIRRRPSYWDLDMCTLIIPALPRLFSSPCEDHIMTACETLRLILTSFSTVISSSVSNPPGAVGVDLCQEERRQKCMTCNKQLQVIKRLFDSRSRTSMLSRGRPAQAIKLLLALFPSTSS